MALLSLAICELGGVPPAGIATSSFRITWLVPDDRVKVAGRANVVLRRSVGAKEDGSI